MDAVLTCMVSEKIGPGETNLRLTQIVRESFLVEGAAAVRSAAIAFQFAVTALDLPVGSGIVISALAPAWHYQVVSKLGFSPIVADVDPDTALMPLASVEDAISRGGRVILYHETLGFLPDFYPILALNVPLIEDISQSAGAEFGGKKAGQFGVFSILGLEERDILTAGGGALLISPNKRESIVLKKIADEAPVTDILPDMNSALAYVQIKESTRNAIMRKDISEGFMRSVLQSRHKTIVQGGDGLSSNYSFPVILSSGVKEVKQYANRKDIEIEPAFAGTVIDRYGETLGELPNARSLLLRCVLFPLYPRLGASNAAKIAKILATLP